MGFFCIFYQVNNLFLHLSYLKSPLAVKLTWKKKSQNQLLLLKTFKNTPSAQLCSSSKTPQEPASAWG